MSRQGTRTFALALMAAGAAGLVLAEKSRRKSPAELLDAPRNADDPVRVVVVGGGFGGLSAALVLHDAAHIALTVIDAHNHHLFQPLLYQVATASLSPANIATPIREILPAGHDVDVLMARVTGVDTVERLVICEDGRRVPYDRLVIATGSEPSYFGHPEWAETAPSLKNLEDALRLRNRGVAAFEEAALAKTSEEQDSLLTFVLIGGGPTGVEMAGAIGEFIGSRLEHVYGLPPHRARVVLVEAGPRILAGFDAGLAAHARRDLEELGVEVRTDTKVTEIENGAVHLGKEIINSASVIWTAGTAATPVGTWLGVGTDKGGRVRVAPDLTVPGHPDIFVIGDAALAVGPDGKALPGLAPVAKQQGHYVGSLIASRRPGRPAPFHYQDFGTLATIGRNKAIAELGMLKLTGRPAWLMWAGVHILFLISFRNRAVVSLEWLFAYITRAQGAGLLIPGETRNGPDPMAFPH